MSDLPQATVSDSLSGIDVMAAIRIAPSQAGFGMAAFCGKDDLSQNNKQKVVNYLVQFAHKVLRKYKGKGTAGAHNIRLCELIIAVALRRRAQDATVLTIQGDQ